MATIIAGALKLEPWVGARAAMLAIAFATVAYFPTLAVADTATAAGTVPAGAPVPARASELPPALTEYMGRKIAPAMSFHGGGASWLLRKMREQEEGTTTLIPQLGLKAGMTVCDLGSGNGYHSLMMARMVAPHGRILAVDIQQEMLDQLKERATQSKIENVEPVLGEVHDPHLPPNSCDLVLMVDVYHEFSHPEHMLGAIRKALKPDGRVALVEFRGEDPDVPIKPEHKMTKAQILKEWLPNGFELAEQFDKLPWQHLMFFKRKP
ncbi:MAG: class I SAM-dependent methyltransferase [Verrucomicrobiales bacterium]